MPILGEHSSVASTEFVHVMSYFSRRAALLNRAVFVSALGVWGEDSTGPSQ